MADNFQGTAIKLSEGPLGIIALFIVLIHGFASLVLGLATNIGEANRSILVWFLVLFPVLVFLIFARLVSHYHINLYPPQAYKDEKDFKDLATYGRAAFDKRELQPDPKTLAPIRHALITALKVSATGSLFWVGHDLMWSADALLRNAPAQQVLIGLAQARHHLVEVGLSNTPMESQIVELSRLIRESKEISASSRDDYANQLGSIIDRIGMAAEAAQADFKVPPHWERPRG